MRFSAFSMQVKEYLSRNKCLINHIISICTGGYDHPSVMKVSREYYTDESFREANLHNL